MFYSRECISKDLTPLRNKMSGIIRIPAPSYVMGERWTDELRLNRGYVVTPDGTWVTEVIVEEYLGKLEESILHLYDEKQNLYKELQILKQQKYQMEYGLRVAAKALKNSLEITQENNNDIQ